MAFTTTSGNPTSITGTDEVDILSTVDLSGNFIVKADEQADTITLVSTSDPSQLTDVSVYGQDGADAITSPQAQLVRGRTQGGEGNDTINYGTVSDYQVYGGADLDNIDWTTAVGSTIQGSKGNDTIGDTTANISGSKVYGGADNDSIDVGSVASSTVQGSAGEDTIHLNATVSGDSKVNGGSDNDTILVEDTVSEIQKGATINGNKGADILWVETGVTVDEITLFGGSGADSITVIDSQTTISGDKGADIIASGTGDAVSVSGGEGADTITSEVNAATETATMNGGAGNDSVALGGAGQTVVMQGREDSTAATAETGNGGAGTAIADGDIITFGDGIDVVTAWDKTGTDTVGTGLDTTMANLNFFGWKGTDVGATKGASVSLKNGAAVAITWGDLSDSGTTTVLAGLLTNGTTFTIGDDNTDDDVLVIMGDGTATTANTSAFVIQGMDADTDGAFDEFGIENSAAFTTYIA